MGLDLMPDTIKFAVHMLHAVAALKFDACADVTRGIPSTRSKWQLVLVATRPAVTHYGVCTSSPAMHHSPNSASKFKIKSTEHFIKKKTHLTFHVSTLISWSSACLMKHVLRRLASLTEMRHKKAKKQNKTKKRNNCLCIIVTTNMF